MISIDLIIVSINAFFYNFALYKYWKVTKYINLGFILLLVYGIISIMCVVNYMRTPDQYHMHILPFAYLFITIMLFIRPYTYKQIKINHDILQKPFFEKFSYLYIVCGFIALFYSWNDVYKALTVSDIMEVLSDAYNGNVDLYHNQVERLAKNFTSYTRILAIILSFSYLTKYNYKPKLAFLLLISSIYVMISTTVINASRGAIAITFLQLLAGYSLFRSEIIPKTKRYITYGGVFVLALAMAYTLSVTFSRFSVISTASFDNPIDSLIFYFGHSMLTFDYGVADTIDNFMWGKYATGSLSDPIFAGGLDKVLGTHFGTAFYTFIGSFYLDWGPFVTLIIAICFSNIMLVKCKKEVMNIADLYLYLYFACFILNGVFVIGPGYYIQVIMAFVLYYGLKFYINNKI